MTTTGLPAQAGAAPPEVPLIPRRILFGPPSRMAPSLSPDGRYLGFLAPGGGSGSRLCVWAGQLASRDFRPLAGPQDRPIRDFAWARDGRHVLCNADRDGDENDHLLAIDLATGAVRDLTPFPGVGCRVVGLAGRLPGQVVVSMNLAARDRLDLYRISLAGGSLTPVAAAPPGDGEGQLTGWVADQQLQVRAAQRAEPDGGLTVFARDDEAGPWRPVFTVDYEDAIATQVVGFTSDGASLLVLSPAGAGTVRLLRVPAVGGAAPEVVYAEDGADVLGVTVHPGHGRPDLVTVQRERTRLVALEPGSARVLARLAGLCRGDVVPLSRDRTDRRWLVLDNADDAPAAYHLFDRESGTVESLFSQQPALAGAGLARMEPFSFTARDGLTVHGYLTFPPGDRSSRRRLPTVLRVHGGPWDRCRWGFRAEPQWLANRGYLCLEVNFRGSTGYGRAFSLAGDHEWGGRMQDDLLDALAWAVSAGYADPGRVAIYGASYGGYAALVGAAFTPGIFSCAIACAAPVNLRTFVASVPGYWKPVGARLRRRIGDPDTEADFLWSRSPLSRAHQIRSPLLLAYGANDPRVPLSEAHQLLSVLQERQIPHEFLLFEDDGHGFSKPANALRFYAAAEAFLARHLGGRCEEP